MRAIAGQSSEEHYATLIPAQFTEMVAAFMERKGFRKKSFQNGNSNSYTPVVSVYSADFLSIMFVNSSSFLKWYNPDAVKFPAGMPGIVTD
jgi:hypothetical protein